MRKISMKRKNKAAENTPARNDSKKEENNGSHVDEEENLISSVQNDSPKKGKNKNTSIQDKKNEKKGKKEKARKSKSATVNGAGSEEENEEQYEVEEVIDQKTVAGKKQYLIRWKGYGSESNTWEPESTINCPELVQNFLDSQSQDEGSLRVSHKKGKKRGPSVINKTPNKSKKTKFQSKTDDSETEETVEEYEVYRIKDVYLKKNGKREFLVHWKGYTVTDNTWEPEENMNCPDIIETFMAKINSARNVDNRELRLNRKPTKQFTLSMQQSGRRLSKRNRSKQRAQYKETE